LGNTGLIQHQPHEDKHRKSNQNGVLDNAAKEATAVREQLDVTDASALKFDIFIDQLARRIKQQFPHQDKDQRNANQRVSDWNAAKQHDDEGHKHRQNHPLVQVHYSTHY